MASRERLTKPQLQLLQVCASYGAGGFEWGQVQLDVYRAAVPAHLEWHRFLRIARALADKGLVTGDPGDAYGQLTEAGWKLVREDGCHAEP